ncbi:MAG: ATP phosphoribosyltransferase regulatory subunit [Oscillospiraceae bacterium]|nr:ATP phosphoribosyltransferase regulatory subunit [Oscillospiraceae bacterium]
MKTYIEQLAQKLGALYGAYGYMAYSMSKFEEYELYLRNKDFLISDRVLTFTDTDGKLMALKPDVTLSIIKNTRDSEGLQKLYYRENVYRPGSSTQGFREIMQVGLECMGNVDSYQLLEVILLAVQSLQAVSDRCVLDISHMGLLSRLLEKCGVTDNSKEKVLAAIGSKNAHEVRALCQGCGADSKPLEKLARISGKISVVLPELEEIFGADDVFAEFRQLMMALEQTAAGKCINIDFSVVNDMRYYNGIAFRGFVEGVPDGILAGGQYDTLMAKMGRKAKAIGFALYPDDLERMMPQETEETGAVLMYAPEDSLADVANAVKSLVKKGLSVKAMPIGSKISANTKTFVLSDKTPKEVAPNA